MSTAVDDPNWEVRNLTLPGGATLSLQLTPTFLARIRTHFKLPYGAYVTDTMLKEVLLTSVRTAVEKAEVEAFRDSTDQQNVIE